jgi:hypothetical protein
LHRNVHAARTGWGVRLTVFSRADDETAEKYERLRRLAG